MSSLVSPAYAATQYALLSSLYALPGKFVGGLSGFMVERWAIPSFFASTALIGVPVALLCLLVWRWLLLRRPGPRKRRHRPRTLRKAANFACLRAAPPR